MRKYQLIFLLCFSIQFINSTTQAARRIDTYRPFSYFNSKTMNQDNIFLIREEPISCDDSTQCLLKSVGFEFGTKYYSSSSAPEAPISMIAEVWEGSNLVFTTPQMIFPNKTGIKYGGVSLTTVRNINSTTNTRIKYYASSAVTGTYDWPTLYYIVPKYGVSSVSTTVQAKPAAAVSMTTTFNSQTKFYTTNIVVKQRTDATRLDMLDVSYFTHTMKRVLTDVNMSTYTKVLTYELLSKINFNNVIATVTNSAVAEGVTSYQYPLFTGMVRSEFNVTDLEGKAGLIKATAVKVNGIKAPPLVGYSVDSDRFLNLNWKAPKYYADGTSIGANLKGFLIYLRDASNVVLSSYKVESPTQVSYRLPKSLSAGTYSVVICGWANDFTEGNCSVFKDIVVN